MKSSDQRKAANEVIFRDHNLRVTAQLNAVIPKENQDVLPLAFTCECSKLDCVEQVYMTLDEYKDAHKDQQLFVTLPGHATPEVEEIFYERDGYLIVCKKIPVPEIREPGVLE